MRNNTRRLTALSLTVAFALILSFVESRIPAFVAIPGIKVGLANIAIIFTLYKFGIKEAIAVSGVRVFLMATLFGSPVSFFYSVCGATLSLTVMFILKKLTPLSEIAVSVSGGVMHNIGQIIAASIMLGTNVVLYYLPFLLLSGVIAGIAVGVASGLLLKKVTLDLDYVKNGKKGKSQSIGKAADTAPKTEEAPEKNPEKSE